MANVYASALGTTVMRHRGVPARDPSLDGKVVVLVPPGGALDAEAALRDALGVHGAVQSIRKDDEGAWHATFASHAAAEAAVAAGQGRGLKDATAIFLTYNGRAYDDVRARARAPPFAPPRRPRGPAHAPTRAFTPARGAGVRARCGSAAGPPSHRASRPHSSSVPQRIPG